MKWCATIWPFHVTHLHALLKDFEVLKTKTHQIIESEKGRDGLRTSLLEACWTLLWRVVRILSIPGMNKTWFNVCHFSIAWYISIKNLCSIGNQNTPDLFQFVLFKEIPILEMDKCVFFFIPMEGTKFWYLTRFQKIFVQKVFYKEISCVFF